MHSCVLPRKWPTTLLVSAINTHLFCARIFWTPFHVLHTFFLYTETYHVSEGLLSLVLQINTNSLTLSLCYCCHRAVSSPSIYFKHIETSSLKAIHSLWLHGHLFSLHINLLDEFERNSSFMLQNHKSEKLEGWKAVHFSLVNDVSLLEKNQSLQASTFQLRFDCSLRYCWGIICVFVSLLTHCIFLKTWTNLFMFLSINTGISNRYETCFQILLSLYHLWVSCMTARRRQGRLQNNLMEHRSRACRQSRWMLPEDQYSDTAL